MSDTFYPVDLAGYANHKLVYVSVPESGCYGLDRTCILRKNYVKEEKNLINGVPFRFPLQEKDNIFCENQEITVGAAGSKLHLLGFAYWGDNFDYFRLRYEDGSEERAEIFFSDWSHVFISTVMNFQYDRKDYDHKTGEIFISSGKEKIPLYLHHVTCGIDGGRKLKSIVLPDNMFMHIFAMTLEA